MKRKLAFALALMLILTMFAACTPAENDGATTPSPANAANQPQQDGETQNAAVPGATLPAAELPRAGETLAVNPDGTLKYEIDDRGYPISDYEYELPLTVNTADEQFSLAKLIFSTELIDEAGLNGMPFQTYLRELTGVNIDYRTTTFGEIGTQFQIDIAAGTLDDIILNGTFYYTGTARQLVDEGFIVNIADYRAYMPNYMWQIPRFDYDVQLEQVIWYDRETVPAVYAFTENCAPNMGMMVRGDYLDRLGMKAEDVVSYDQIHDMFKRMQTELGIEHPMQIGATVETIGGVFFGGMNTSMSVSTTRMPAIRIENSKVTYTTTEEIDRQAMELLSTWFAEGIVDPNWLSNASDSQGAEARVLEGKIAYWESNPGQMKYTQEKSIDPNARWDGLPLNKLTPDTQFQFARGTRAWALAFSSWAINAECSNIPLVLSYADYYYSTEGGFILSYGEEGMAWTTNEKGNPEQTEFVLADQTGWILNVYAGCPFSDVGLLDQMRSYAYPGGERFVEVMRSWVVPNYPFKGGMDWPSSNAKGTDEERDEINNLSADAVMYVSENFLKFVDGTTPMSGWDSYISGLENVGVPRMKSIWQSIYDRFIDDNPDYAQK